MVVREQLHIDPPNRNVELIEPDRRATTGVDEEFLVAGLNQGARTEPFRARDRHTGPEQGHFEVAAHCEILILASLTILVQRTISELTVAPNSAGAPPPGSTPSLASASRTFSAWSALSIAALSCAVAAGGVPALISSPAQSSLASFG